MRDFRVDRILNLKITDESGSIKKNDELKKYFKKVWGQGDLNEVTVWFDNSIASSLVSVKYYFGYVDERIKDNGVEMNFTVNDYNYIARWLLSYSDKIKIIKPPELKQIIIDLVQNLAKVYLSQVKR
jgi:predicted DNA-binding transcriptional regulator YafY